MPPAHTPASRRRKQRVDVACDFCRQRKLGCNNGKPKCENCDSYQRSCTYTVRARKERPSNSTINHLREENSRLREAAERSRQVPPTPQIEAVDEASQPVESHETHFHGPTSAMFDAFRRKSDKSAEIDVATDTSRKTQLLAETARQRQLEPINFRLKKLDFDSVDPELAMQLLSVFWNRQHATGSIVYRPSFMRDMASPGPYFSKLLLNAIYFSASKHRPGSDSSCSSTDICQGGTPFRRRVDELLYRPQTGILLTSSITTIQALIIISDTLFSWCDERSLAWHYLGIATNMIIDLGIHVEISALKSGRLDISAEELEIRRRVFWAAFVLDKVQSLYQGRPARLRDMDCSVPIKFLDEYEELEPFDTVGYSASPGGLGDPTYSVSTFQQLCRLCRITDHILFSLYSERCAERSRGDLLQTSNSLHADLTEWRQSLPSHLSLKFDASGRPNMLKGCMPLPHTLCLVLMYQALLILLHRPFVAEGHLKSAADMAASEVFSTCENAALEIDTMLSWYRTQWCMKSPPYFLSYATYVSATIHVRTAAQRRPDSKAHQCLRNCLEILSEHQHVCHAPRRALAILLGLVKRLKVDVGHVFTASTSRTADRAALESRNLVDDTEPHSSQNTLTTYRDVAPHAGALLAANANMSAFSTEPTHLGAVLPQTPLSQTADIPITDSQGFDGQLLDLAFDFDPLFGFEGFQMDSTVDLFM